MAQPVQAGFEANALDAGRRYLEVIHMKMVQ
jgi:hypothetical protein